MVDSVITPGSRRRGPEAPAPRRSGSPSRLLSNAARLTFPLVVEAVVTLSTHASSVLPLHSSSEARRRVLVLPLWRGSVGVGGGESRVRG